MASTAVTIRDVARVAGVSKSAVSAALTGNGRIKTETKAAILQVAAEMGFEPNANARRLQGKGLSQTVGLFTLDLDLSVGISKIKRIRNLLACQGFEVTIHSCNYPERNNPSDTMREMKLLCQQRPRAIICNTTDLPVQVFEALQSYRAQGGVLVCYDRPVNAKCDQIVFDREDNTFRAANHLLELGHRDIGFFDAHRIRPGNLRVSGIVKALTQHDLQLRTEWIYSSTHNGEFEEGGVAMAAYFLSLKHRPTAVCIVNDYAAIAFISEVQRAGLRVPEDVSVVGHDDRLMARYCSVPLSSVAHPVDDIAQAVVDVLLQRLNGEVDAPFQLRTVQGKLAVRQSTAAFPSYQSTI